MLRTGALLVGSLIAVTGTTTVEEAAECQKELWKNLADISACNDITADKIPSCLTNGLSTDAVATGLVQQCDGMGYDAYKKSAVAIDEAQESDDSGAAYLNVGMALLGSATLALIL